MGWAGCTDDVLFGVVSESAQRGEEKEATTMSEVTGYCHKCGLSVYHETALDEGLTWCAVCAIEADEVDDE